MNHKTRGRGDTVTRGEHRRGRVGERGSGGVGVNPEPEPEPETEPEPVIPDTTES